MGDVRRVSGALESRDTIYTQDSVIGGTDCTGRAETRSWGSHGGSWIVMEQDTDNQVYDGVFYFIIFTMYAVY